MKSLFICFCLGLTLLPILGQQPEKMSASSPDLMASVQFLAWEKPDERLAPTLWGGAGGKYHVAQLDCFDLTTPTKYRGSAKMVFTARGEVPSEKNSFILEVDPKWKHILILVGKDSSHPSGLRLMALDHSVAHFPWGSYRIINTTGVPLKMRLDTKLVKIPKDRKSVTVQLQRQSGMIKMLATAAQSSSPFFGCISEHRQDTRKILIFSRQTNKRLGPLALRIIPERKVELSN